MDAIGIENRPYTETDALVDILNWSRRRPEWLRDALRRLSDGGELSEQDIDELEAVCLGEVNESYPPNEAPIKPRCSSGKPVAITGLREAVGVNAPALNQGPTFGLRSLTIVYEHNGYGKSVFVRVFKSACRSPDEKAAILRDVNAADEFPRSAQIDFEVDGNAEKYGWNPEPGELADLPAVSTTQDGGHR